MSQLTIVLYTVAIIASASAGSSARNRNKQDNLLEVTEPTIKDIVYSAELAEINRQTANHHINQSIEKIKERSAELYRQVIELGPQTGEELVSVTIPYSVKVSNHLATMESFINHYVVVSRRNGFNPTICHNNYTDYNIAVRTHMPTLLKQVSYDVYNEATMKIGQLLHMVHENINRINNLKVKAMTCNKLECDDISKAAKDIEAAYHVQTDNGLKDYMKMVDKTALIQKLDVSWSYWVDMGLEIMQSAYDCMFPTSEPTAHS